MDATNQAPRVTALDRLPIYSWDGLAPLLEAAKDYPGPTVNLSAGNPVDPTPAFIAEAMARGSNAPSYVTPDGSVELRTAITDWLARMRNVSIDPTAVLPLIGTREVLSWIELFLDLGPGDVVAVETLAYPAYKIGVGLVGAELLVMNQLADLPTDGSVKLIVINTPQNPGGTILGVDELRGLVDWARRHDAVILSDECYSEFVWEGEAISLLDPRVTGGDTTNLLITNSCSKRSNMAGYRLGFIAGDPHLTGPMLGFRSQMGLGIPLAMQHAMIAALGDEEHVRVQAERYRARRDGLTQALRSTGWTVADCRGGLFLWASLPGRDGWDAAQELAQLGIIVAPGELYGAAGLQNVRIALTAVDRDITAAIGRIAARTDFSGSSSTGLGRQPEGK
ncbi:succinyldiaminopimelate transaminase [Aeromicrobium sp. YIM 150415]|uniref:succinyldiaminopimelate transaminase n=1 Tax=Aeromicrobium sp. YIM 150415 TaxID=2803912 RepID=UPI0019632C3E|nr:succinyldiaminopimelate transaminase [Aeromicrobium sp. YIM 150415]MBM9462429.1 succinyldiaminopimelate transaminase [Aeromicrobium sp. YIM 150415]